MYWAFGFQQSAIEQLLDRKGFTLDELLNEDDLLQELRTLNRRLVEYLSGDEVVDQLLALGAGNVPIGSDEATVAAQTKAFLASEVLSCDVPPITAMLTGSPRRMAALFAFLDAPAEEIDQVRATFCVKMVVGIIERQPKVMNDYFTEHGELMDRLAVHIGCAPVFELVLKIVFVDSEVFPVSEFLGKCSLVGQLVEVVMNHAQDAACNNASQVLVDCLNRFLQGNSPVAAILRSFDFARKLLNACIMRSVGALRVIEELVRLSGGGMEAPEGIRAVTQSLPELATTLRECSSSRVGVACTYIVQIAEGLAKIGGPEVDAALIDSRIFAVILELFASKPNHSILHNSVTAVIMSCLVQESERPLTVALLRDYKLLDVLVSVLKANDEAVREHPGNRLGQMGHVLVIASAVQAIYVQKPTSVVAEAARATDDWNLLSAAALSNDAARERPIGGKRPATLNSTAVAESFKDIVSSAGFAVPVNIESDSDSDEELPMEGRFRTEQAELRTHAVSGSELPSATRYMPDDDGWEANDDDGVNQGEAGRGAAMASDEDEDDGADEEFDPFAGDSFGRPASGDASAPPVGVPPASGSSTVPVFDADFGDDDFGSSASTPVAPAVAAALASESGAADASASASSIDEPRAASSPQGALAPMSPATATATSASAALGTRSPEEPDASSSQYNDVRFWRPTLSFANLD